MAIKSNCQTNVITISKTSTVKDVSQLMLEKHVGSVVVTETYQGKKIPTGIITDRDIAIAFGSTPNSKDLKIEHIMRSQPVTVKVSEGIYEATTKMRENGVKRLPVVNEDGSLFGIICSDDLLRLMSQEISNLAKITEIQVNKERGMRMPASNHVEL